ncbi:MAG: undecaprenyl-diphosphate phosphatase [Oscillospiraceae bacterium]|nr:undecaprenyl-diphosphate phosphatase [Oscillospiraceae bacterium]
MIEYIKMLILSLVSGVMAPLPVSSSAHFALLSNVMNFSGDERMLGFYSSVFGLTFSVVIFIFLRKIYAKGISALFTSTKSEKGSQLKPYRSVMKNILLSLLPMILLFIPVSLEEPVLLIDYFDKFLRGNSLFLVAFACIINALILVIAIWYAKNADNRPKRVSGTGTAMRMSFYQLVSYVIPGFSHVSSGCVNMLICDIHPRVIMREIYLYVAPQMFAVNLVRMIRYIVTDIIVDPITLAVAVVAFGIVCAVTVHLSGRFNMKNYLGFFCVYSVILGLGSALTTFIN